MKNVPLYPLICLVLVGLFSPSHSEAQWVQSNGLSGYGANVSALTVSGSNLFAAAGGGVFRSTDNGANWVAADSGLSNADVVCLTINGSRLFAGALVNGIFVSTDNGATWTVADSGLAAAAVISLGISGSNLLAGADGQGIFLSTNDGTSWTQTGVTNAQVYAFATISSNLFAATAGNGVLLSTDSGTTWTPLNSSPDGANTLVALGTNLFLGTDLGGIFASTNHGVNWVPLMSPGLANTNVNVLVANGANLFAGTDDGVFLLKDTIWTQTGLPSISVRALIIDDTNMFAGTYGHGVYRRPLSEMITSIKQPSSQLPESFALYQNYPNPFNPSSVISYQLATNGLVTLKVFDVLGREVETLVDERQSAGGYSVKFNGTNLPSGVYFYRLQVGTYHDTKKLLLLK